ncbi:MAG: hypothetical protein HYR93_02895 [Chloroflexi bacterium]|nr:hypothetical protein [Chloroflexota bacterium]
MQPGTAFAFTYPYDITITPFKSQTTIDTPIIIRGSCQAGDALSWSLDSPNATYDPASGVFLAHREGTYLLKATDGRGHAASATVTVLKMPQLSISPETTKVKPGGRIQFSAALDTTTDQLFNWRVLPGGSGGTISPDGIYTAPDQVGTDQIVVESIQFPGLTAHAQVFVTPLSLSVVPDYLEMNIGGSFQFTGSATFGGVAWSAPGGGTIQADGRFSPPARPGTYTVVLTSNLDPTVTASATVVVGPPSILIGVVEPNGGTITPDGIYKAPNTTGAFTVKGVSNLDSAVTASAAVVVINSNGGGPLTPATPVTPIMNGVRVTPGLSQVRSGTYQAFNATVFGLADQSVTWSVATDSKAAIDSQGVFVATRPGTYEVKATSLANGAYQGSAAVIVTSSVDTLEDKAPAALKREGYSVTALPNGKILIAGGWDGANYRSDCYLYDPGTQTFSPTGSMVETHYTVIDEKGQAISMSVSAGRSGHTATLLKDGRVLIANGVGHWSNDALPAPTTWTPLPFAQVYDPVSGTFQNLPGPSVDLPVPGWMGARAYHVAGTSASLGNGQAILAGGDAPDAAHSTVTLFDSVGGLFSALSTSGIGLPNLAVPGSYLGIGQDAAATTLQDGRALLLGGWIGQYPLPPTPDANFDNSATLYDPQSGFTPVGQMINKRAAATATTLADGRVLIAGGASTAVAHINGNDYYAPTNTVEIFDPKTNAFTAAASMKWPRSGHASLLLPTGQVLVVGGFTFQTMDGSGTAYQKGFPTETELYDPDTNTWRVMDDLGYGLQDPKLALQPDGNVFITGIQITSDAPTAQASLMGGGGKLKLAANRGLNAAAATTSSTTSTTVFGVVNVGGEIETYPEEPALQYSGGTLKACLDGNGRPAKARISIPMQGDVNRRHRYYVLRVPKDSMPGKGQVTGISVRLRFYVDYLHQDEYVQDVLGTLTSPEPLATSSTFFLDSNPRNPTHVEYDSQQNALDGFSASSIPNEASRESTRLAWLTATNWIDLDKYLYYKVRVTMTQPSQIPYGRVVVYGPDGTPSGVNLVPAPDGRMAYSFRLWYTFEGKVNQYLDFNSSGATNLVPTYNARDFMPYTFGLGSPLVKMQTNAAMLSWVMGNASALGSVNNATLLGPVNEITLEHGRNTPHHAEHLRGEAFDIYHMGYRELAPALANGNPSQSGTVFMDSTVRGIFNQALNTDPAVSGPAKTKLAAWIYSARQGLDRLAAVTTTNWKADGSYIGSGFYLRDSNVVYDQPTNTYIFSTDAVFHSAVRDLLWDGVTDRPGANLDLTEFQVDLMDGNTVPLGEWDQTQGVKDSIKPDNSGGHDSHIHILPQGKMEAY